MHASAPQARSENVRQAIDLLCRRRNVHPDELAAIIGKSRSTAYRRLAQPSTLSLDELERIADRFGAPVEVIVAGEMATMRWLVDQGTDGGGGGGGAVVTARYQLDLEPDLGLVA